jgi:hypothetical protein
MRMNANCLMEALLRLGIVGAVAVAGCGGRAGGTVSVQRPRSLQSVAIGECGDPRHDGVISESPRLVHADRDLGGDRTIEQVVTDRNLCDEAGNCQWNVFFAPQGEDGCRRYVGTLAAATLEPLQTKGQSGMLDIRAYWALPSGRTLVQDYRFNRGGYRAVDALLCRSSGDDRLECAEEEVR